MGPAEASESEPKLRSEIVFWTAVVLAWVGGAWLRFRDLGGPSFWLDEILHLRIARALSEQSLLSLLAGVEEIGGGTENGLLYYSLLHLGDRLVPGEVGARLAPALIGTLTLPLMTFLCLRLGREHNADLLSGRPFSLSATIVFAISPLHVYFSREARPYYLLMTLALVLLLALLEAKSRTGLAWAWSGCLLATFVGAHSIPLLASFAGATSLLAVGVLAASETPGLRPRLTRLLRSPLRHYLVAAALALAMSYLLYIARSEVNTPDRASAQTHVEMREAIGFQSPLSTRSRDRFVASMTTSGKPARPRERSWLLVAAATLGGLALVLGSRRDGLLSIGMFLLPAGLSFAALLTVGRWYGVRYTSVALPGFLVLTAAGLVACGALATRFSWCLRDRARTPGGANAKRSAPSLEYGFVGWLVTGLLLSLLVLPNFEAARDDPHGKINWRSIASFFDEIALEDEVILVPSDWPQISLGFYLEAMDRPTEFVRLWESADRGAREVAARSRGWLLTAGYRRSNQLRAWMRREFVHVLRRRQEGVALYFFPDFATFFETRYAAGRQGPLEDIFSNRGHRFEFGGGEAILQGSGWSFPERGPDRDFQWALGAEAEIGLPISNPRDATIRFSAQPLVYPGAPSQSVELWINDTRVGGIELSQGWSEHEVAVPASSWSDGANILYLRFANPQRPARVLKGSSDRRELAAAFDYLEVADSP